MSWDKACYVFHLISPTHYDYHVCVHAKLQSTGDHKGLVELFQG